MRLLAARDHSRVELTRKLEEKGFAPLIIQEAIVLFSQEGLQSDDRYAEVFVRSSYEKGKGPAFIEQRLQQHDIDASTISSLLADPLFDWFDSAARVRDKRFGEKMPDEWSEIQKQKRFLQYRGFYQVHINEVFG